jgi:hypothetical protein
VHDIEPLNRTARESLTNLFNMRISSINMLLDNNRLIDAERELDSLDRLYNGHNEKQLISELTIELNRLRSLNQPPLKTPTKSQ